MVVTNDPLGPTQTKVSEEGRDPCWLGVSVVNCVWGLRE